MMISVVIVTYNPKQHYLERAIDSVLGQTLSQSSYEFFIVDNNSNPPVKSLTFVRQRRIRVVNEPRQGLTAGRERATRCARGDILVFVDDDNVIAPNYLEKTLELFRDSRIGVLSGQIEPEYETKPDPWFYRFEEMLAIRKFPRPSLYLTSVPDYTRYFPIGAGIVVRREILLEYFRELTEDRRVEGRIGKSLSSGEDLDIDFYALSKGYLIGSAAMLRCTHLIPESRLSVQYVTLLGRSSLRSVFQVNQKWKPVFGQDIYHFFSTSKFLILIKIVVYGCLYPLKRFRVLFNAHVVLYQLLSSSQI